MKDIKTIFAGARAATLNDSAVQALVRFFQDSTHPDINPGYRGAAVELARAFGVDRDADRDTLEMAIRHALTKDQS